MPWKTSEPDSFMSKPIVVGGILASGALVLPPQLIGAIFNRVPKPLANDRTLLPVQIRIILRFLPIRVHLAVGGFVLGYLGRKYVNWLRLCIIRQLLKYQGWMQRRNWKIKIWGLLLRLAEGRGPFRTFEFQKSLPKQPLPDLDRTLDEWLEVSKTFVSEFQYQSTEDAIKEFRTNEGPKLQAFLRKKFETTENWIHDYWLFAAYLSYREPLTFNSNYYTTSVLPEYITRDQMARAATFITLLAKYDRLLCQNEVEPIMMQDIVPLCMHGYSFIFNMTRVPGEHIDTPTKYTNQRHIVVIRNGHYFRLETEAAGDDGKLLPLSAEEMKLQLQRICDEADGLNEELPVAALTAQNRTVWAKQRLALATKNKETLEAIEKSLFIAVLDEGSPVDANDLTNIVMAGRGNDRWFDKCFNFITFANAYCGSNIEHSVLDAMIFVSMNEYVMMNEKYENGDIVRELERPPRKLSLPKRLLWNLTGMEDSIAAALRSFKELSSDIDLNILHCKYGKGFMKKCRLSPDGYIQMALQLAYCRLHKETPKTYEPATLRLYALGRTETIHPGSKWSVQWTKKMDDPLASVEEKKALLNKAISHQTQFRMEATAGSGCDRHLLGLLCASRELGMDLPKIFRDDAWTKGFKLSTSQTPNRIFEVVGSDTLNYPLCNGGFGPSCHDGYGISYIIYGDTFINISIASWHSCNETDSIQFAKEIDRAMDDMKSLYSTK